MKAVKHNGLTPDLTMSTPSQKQMKINQDVEEDST